MPRTQLKIGPLPDTTPVKLNITVEPALSDDLQLYSQAYEQAYGQKQDVTSLIPSMLRAFLATDTGFKKARKDLITST